MNIRGNKAIRNNEIVMVEVNRFLNMLKTYTSENRSYMFDETMKDIKDKDINISNFIMDLREYLKDGFNENMTYGDKDNAEWYREHLERFESLNIALIQMWQDRLLKIRNIEEYYIVDNATVRKIH